MALPKFKTRKTVSSQPEQFQTESPKMASALTRESANLVGNIAKAGTSIAKGVESYQAIMEKKERLLKIASDNSKVSELSMGFTKKAADTIANREREARETGDWRSYHDNVTSDLMEYHEEIQNMSGLSPEVKSSMGLKANTKISSIYATAKAKAEKEQILQYRATDREYRDTLIKDVTSIGDAISAHSELSYMNENDSYNTPDVVAQNSIDSPKRLAQQLIDSLLEEGNTREAERLLTGKLSDAEKGVMDGLDDRKKMYYKNALNSKKKSLDNARKKAENDAATKAISGVELTGRNTPPEKILELRKIANSGGDKAADADIAAYVAETLVQAKDTAEADTPFITVPMPKDLSDPHAIRKYRAAKKALEKDLDQRLNNSLEYFGPASSRTTRVTTDSRLDSWKSVLDRDQMGGLELYKKITEEFGEDSGAALMEFSKKHPEAKSLEMAHYAPGNIAEAVMSVNEKDLDSSLAGRYKSSDMSNAMIKYTAEYRANIVGNPAKKSMANKVIGKYAKILMDADADLDIEDAVKKASEEFSKNVYMSDIKNAPMLIPRSEIKSASGENYIKGVANALLGVDVDPEVRKNRVFEGVTAADQKMTEEEFTRLFNGNTPFRVQYVDRGKNERGLVASFQDRTNPGAPVWVEIKQGDKAKLFPIQEISGGTAEGSDLTRLALAQRNGDLYESAWEKLVVGTDPAQTPIDEQGRYKYGLESVMSGYRADPTRPRITRESVNKVVDSVISNIDKGAIQPTNAFINKLASDLQMEPTEADKARLEEVIGTYRGKMANRKDAEEFATDIINALKPQDREYKFSAESIAKEFSADPTRPRITKEDMSKAYATVKDTAIGAAEHIATYLDPLGSENQYSAQAVADEFKKDSKMPRLTKEDITSVVNAVSEAVKVNPSNNKFSAESVAKAFSEDPNMPRITAATVNRIVKSVAKSLKPPKTEMWKERSKQLKKGK